MFHTDHVRCLALFLAQLLPDWQVGDTMGTGGGVDQHDDAGASLYERIDLPVVLRRSEMHDTGPYICG